MARWNASLGSIVIVGLALCLASSASAEVSVAREGQRAETLILGSITDDPNPIGIWLQFRSVSVDRVLNPGGHARDDAPPDICWRANSWPVVVWAFNTGGDHDVALSEWTGDSWSETEFLTSSPDDERDPRVFVEGNGTVHVVWWNASTNGEVLLSTRLDTTVESEPPVLVNDGTQAGRRPDVAIFDDVLWIAYERDSNASGAAQEVVISRREANGSFTFDVVAETLRTDPLDVMLHVAAGRLWLDWKHGADEFGYAELGVDDWGDAALVPWTDTSWVGEEGTRRLIRRAVIHATADVAPVPDPD